MRRFVVVTRAERQDLKRLRLRMAQIESALNVFDNTPPPRSHVDALDVIAELRFWLGGHHVAYPENIGNSLFDRSATPGPWAREGVDKVAP